MAEKKTLLILDSNSLIHRAYHALPPFRTSGGEMTNAVYGFLLILFKALKEFPPDYIAATFDSPGPTERSKKFEQYKAKRAKADDELYEQMPRVKEILRAMNIAVYEKQGFEADDLIGTIAKEAKRKQAKPPLSVVIVSGDMDTLQLVDKRTRVYTARKGIQDTVLYDEKAVKERFSGLTPSQMTDYKGLRGDPSDNIPGVTGVGEKTATTLLNEFGSLEKLYAAAGKEDQRIKPKLRENLLQYKDQAFLSKELGTIDCSVPTDVSLGDLAWPGYEQEKVRGILRELEIHSLIDKLPVPNGAAESQGFFKDGVAEQAKRFYDQEVFSKEVYDLEIALIPVISRMEELGAKIDIPYFAKLEKEVAKELKGVEKRIFAMGGREFNVSSPQQVAEVLFTDLEISAKRIKKTPGGALSTASTELEKIAPDHPIVEEILWHREIQKLYSTYILPLPEKADGNGRVHTHFDQLGTATGRISSSDPNLQNIPVQTEWGKRIRRGFIAERGYRLVSFDYSQMELRIAAHVAQDTKMLEFFAKGADIHTMTASEVFQIPPEKITKDMRFRAKALNFGVLYGMGARGFAHSAKIPMQEAQDFIDDYFLRFPGIQRYIEKMKAKVEKDGYTETLLGRRRYLPDIHSSAPQLRAAAERMAVNHPLQGTAADVTKTAMVDIARTMPSERMLLQIHDELLFEIPAKEVEAKSAAIQKIMEKDPLGIKLVVEAKAGKNWIDMEKL
ncbi:MAG: DNA polymerase [bacterium]|nr:DNA polymerase [bacterium]